MKKKTTRASKVKLKPSAGLPKPIATSKTFKSCASASLKFKTTADLKPSYSIIAQSRAKRAINMGLGIRSPGYNIYVAGVPGTGKTSVIKQLLNKWAKEAPAPDDWLYLYNFKDAEAPRCYRMPHGRGSELKEAMEALIKDFKRSIPEALQSEDYENTVNAYLSQMNERKSRLFAELEKLAKSMDFVIKSSRVGIETIPVLEGRQLTEKDYSKLSDAIRASIESQRAKLEPEVLDFARKVRNIEAETRNQIEDLRTGIGHQIVSGLVDPLIDKFAGLDEIIAYLSEVKGHVIDNLLDFIDEDDNPEAPELHPQDQRERFQKYKVNLFVDNSQERFAPVVIENNPTYYNLFGKIEKNVENGMYLTDFTMVKSGAVHRANGGYLVINVMDIFRNSSTWHTLKRVLRNRMGFIEDMGEQYSLLPTSGLRPEPVPLDMKVILIGTDDIYHILFGEDEEFQKIFKIKADFDWKMVRNQKNIQSYVTFIATRSQVEGLLPFDPSGVGAVVEYSSRLVEDQRLLSTQFGEIKDLTIEADFIAREHRSKLVRRIHVEAALEQKYSRLNLQEENLLKMVETNDILLTADGAAIGQINGLVVYDYGDYAFGKIGRITCTTSISDSGIINIERASHLSGRIHDKGIYILSGFLHAVLARKRRMGLSASICFEQSYGPIDGDSASAAELIAIISGMADIPVKQNMGITGSINQMGEIQPIGGVNEKVEGFYKVCRTISRKRDFAVVIPYQNVPNLMLSQEVRQAISKGILKVYAVKHIWEAFELMTGVPLGLKSIHSNRKFPQGTALQIIDDKLDQIHREEMEAHEPEAAPAAAAKKAARSGRGGFHGGQW